MKTLIVVPMKDPASAKTRLAGDLGAAARKRLVRLLYTRTLDLLAPVAQASGADLAVITRSPQVAALAQAGGVRVMDEPRRSDLNTALKHAAQLALGQGYDRLCVIPADLAAPAPSDLLHLLDSRASVTICPSADQGTNALLLSPPDAIGFRYGPRSALLHRQEAQARGLTTCLLPLDSLSFDIDTSTCLTRAIRAVPDIARACA